MVWGYICGNEKAMLVQVKSKMDRFQYLEILENAMIPSAWSIRGLDYIFMHDNASCHNAHLITDCMDGRKQCSLYYLASTIFRYKHNRELV